jgi:hypothetical protein
VPFDIDDRDQAVWEDALYRGAPREFFQCCHAAGQPLKQNSKPPIIAGPAEICCWY